MKKIMKNKRIIEKMQKCLSLQPGSRLRMDKKLFGRIAALLLADVIIIAFCMVGALWIRYDFIFSSIDEDFLHSIFQYMAVNILCTVIIYAVMHLYTSLWQFAGMIEFGNIIIASAVSTVLQIIGLRLLRLNTPRSYGLIYVVLLAVCTFGIRFFWRFLRAVRARRPEEGVEKNSVRTLIIGAGEAGVMIMREMMHSAHLNNRVCCVVDDDPTKQGRLLNGIPIAGSIQDIPRLAEQYDIDEIILAIPTLGVQRKKEILEICRQTACRVLSLPGMYQMVNGEINLAALRPVEIEELLGREPVKLDDSRVAAYIRGKIVLVTGGGGSIGSEICRQVAGCDPKMLILFDIYENSAHDIKIELTKNYPNLNLKVLIGSVRDKKRIDGIFSAYHPDIIFHAAAHKHVPLMEDSPNESVKNNVSGTWTVAHAADEFGAEMMVLISTDKAVRPTNIMGASKRLCELIVQCFAQDSKTRFASVRFGNVLGSNGSVIPLFERQIREGGPVTVTHPEIIRYFMTISEAVSLVLQCGTLAQDGEIFILDMGKPVKILDLAKKMIRQSGAVPDKDIKIEFTGLRPGEKLYEELLIDESDIKCTVNEKIFVAAQTRVNAAEFLGQVKQLIHSAKEENTDIREELRRLVPEYHEERVNS